MRHRRHTKIWVVCLERVHELIIEDVEFVRSEWEESLEQVGRESLSKPEPEERQRGEEGRY